MIFTTDHVARVIKDANIPTARTSIAAARIALDLAEAEAAARAADVYDCPSINAYRRSLLHLLFDMSEAHEEYRNNLYFRLKHAADGVVSRLTVDAGNKPPRPGMAEAAAIYDRSEHT